MSFRIAFDAALRRAFASRGRRAAVLALALLALGAVIASRGARLARGVLWDAHGERRWGHLWNRPQAIAQLEALAPGIPEGSRVLLALAPDEDAKRWRAFATYALPRHHVVVAPVKDRWNVAPPPDVTLFAGRDGRVRFLDEGATPKARNGARAPAGGAGSPDGGPFRVALGALLVALAGVALAPAGAVRGAPARIALGGTLALVLLAPLLVAAGLAGVRLGPVTIVLLAALTAALGLLARRGGKGAWRGEDSGEGSGEDPDAPWVRVLAACALAAALAVVAVKVLRMPIWTLDHHFWWGLKTRLLFPEGRLDPFRPELLAATPTYPLGLPVGWRALALGALPTRAAFLLLHALAMAALVLVLHGALRARTSSRAVAALLAAWAALSPPFWDTEVVGIADVPFALTLLAAGVLLIAPGRSAVAAGIALAGLPWLKQEGTVAAVALLLAGFFGLGLAKTSRGASEGRRKLAIAGGIAALGLAAVQVVRHFWLPPPGEGSFLTAGWMDRLRDRLGRPSVILGFAARELLQPDWLLFWPLLAAGTAAAMLLRRRRALALLGAVWLVELAYVAVFFVTYIDPVAHMDSAFFRISGALVPLGILGLGELLSPEAAGAVTAGEGTGSRAA